MSDTQHYYALVYFTLTGQVVDEIPLAADPTWLQQINADGSWTVRTQIGSDADAAVPGNVLLSKTRLRGIADSWRFSVAICWGDGATSDYVCQAGPLISDQLMSEQPPMLQLGGAGLWALLRMIMQVTSTWPGTSLADGSADATYTGQLRDIAIQILTNAAARVGFPIDIPTVSGTGSMSRTYYGYNLVSAGQVLQDLTQVQVTTTTAGVSVIQQGPDILLKPYRSDASHIRHTALLGNPTLSVEGNPLVFDYPGNVIEILPTRDGSKLSTTSYQKGNGMEYATLWAKSTDPTLPAAGWPKTETAGMGQSQIIVQSELQQWSDGQQALTGRPIETWAVRMRMDDIDYPFGSYDPGFTGTYNVRDHCWLLDNAYTKRILGFTNGGADREFRHILQGSS